MCWCCSSTTPRLSWIRCLVILATVIVLNIPVSVSLPYLPIFDIARVRFNSTVTLQEGLGKIDIQELRLGIWSACYYNSSDARTCLKAGCGYTVHMSKIVGNQTFTATIPSRFTTGLVMHPVSDSVIFIVFLCSLTTTHREVMLYLGRLASLLSWTAFWIDISLMGCLGSQVGDHTFEGTIAGGTGFWISISASFLFMLSGCLPRPRKSVVNAVPLQVIKMDPPTPGVPAP